MGSGVKSEDVIGRIRAICLAMPEAKEQPFGGHTAPSFRVREKLFVTTYEDGSAMCFKAGPGVQQVLVGSNPKRFFVPAYVGNKGWVGMKLDGKLDWDEVRELIEDSYRIIAPKRLAEGLGISD